MTLSLKGSAGHAQWRPFREFENLYAEMDRRAQSVLGGLAGDGAWLPAAHGGETDSAYVTEGRASWCAARGRRCQSERQRFGGNRRGEGAQARGFVPPPDP